ncbi:hypothetical protein KP79_PYT26072 [Mizuhopecten yessoensis]|uniref:Acyl-ACP thioesterase-like C-terminal domain-containing protein n=1 Tax=Mizuhopecten yessoensis TaxID=6573 RepID=A0A210PGR0_MIZYE|nr:hypothetical protein KP79_PYT26072 [Mizuhopecten yessoensis]
MGTKTNLLQLVSLPRPTWVILDRFGHLPFDGTIKFLWEGYPEMIKQGFPTKLIQKAFTVREKAVCSPQLHEKGFPENNDIFLHASVPNVGTTSYSIFHDLIDSSTMGRIFRIETKMVNIDPETRRPSKLPTAFVEECTKFASSDPAMITDVQEEFVPPKNAFKSIIRTRYSDLDINLHVNYAQYYKFCADCASEASQSGYYRHYDDDICRLPVLKTDVSFIGESPPCSNLDVYSWQDTQNQQRIYFAIYLKSDRIFQADYLYGCEKSDEAIVSKL